MSGQSSVHHSTRHCRGGKTWLWLMPACLGIILYLTSCGVFLQDAEPTLTSTSTLTPFPSYTPLPSATHTPSPTSTPSPTPAFTPPPTSTSLFMVLPNTPIPMPLATIGVSNALQASCLAQWVGEQVTDLEWTPEENMLAVAHPASISLYDYQSRLLLRTLHPSAEGIFSVKFSPDGAWLVAASRRGDEQTGYTSSLDIWRGAGIRPMGLLYGEASGLSSMEFTPDSAQLLTAFASPNYEDNGIHFFDTWTWEMTGTLLTGPVLDISISPDGKYFATTPDRYAINIWERVYDPAQEQTLFSVKYKIYTSFTGAVNQIVFSPAAGIFATGHYDGEIKIWDLATGQLVRTLLSDGVVSSLAFSPDGQLLASGSQYENSLIRIWSVVDGRLLRTMDGHAHGVTNLLFSPDGQLLVSASYDGEVRVWGLRP